MSRQEWFVELFNVVNASFECDTSGYITKHTTWCNWDEMRLAGLTAKEAVEKYVLYSKSV